MPEKLWNMLKLVPGISASRKSSLITGLARIDKNTEEFILNVYHLPDPSEFLGVEQATYFAWYYDGETQNFGKLGELRRKNKLTYNLKNKHIPKGDGIFITVENSARIPKKPGEILLSSNRELFYQGLNDSLETTLLTESIEQKSYNFFKEEISTEKIKIVDFSDPISKTKKDIVEVSEPSEIKGEIKVDFASVDYTQGHENELTDELIVQGNQEANSILGGDIASAESPLHEISQEKTEQKNEFTDTEMVESKSDYFDPFEVFSGEHGVKSTAYGSANTDFAMTDKAKIDDQFKEFVSKLYEDFHGTEIAELVKDNYTLFKEEFDLEKYKNKCKRYIFNFYEETELKDFYEKIVLDFNYLLHKVDLEELWNKFEGLTVDLVENSEIRDWISIAKNWLRDLDISEFYQRMNIYVEAFLSVITPEEFWYKLKNWFEGLLDRMDIGEIMLWVRTKIGHLREMDINQVKAEFINIFSTLIDELKIPELKLAMIKATLRDRFGQVGDVFQQIKKKAEDLGGEEKVEAQIHQQINPNSYLQNKIGQSKVRSKLTYNQYPNQRYYPSSYSGMKPFNYHRPPCAQNCYPYCYRSMYLWGYPANYYSYKVNPLYFYPFRNW